MTRTAPWKRIAWKHPEWWAIGLSGLAWTLIATRHHEHHHPGEASSLTAGVSSWLLMSVAMMVPLVAESIRTAEGRSLWMRRHRAIAGFLLGYLSAWFVAGLIISGLLFGIGRALQSHPMGTAAAGFALAAAWQLTPAKRRGLWSCHRTLPMAPEGWPADRDAIRFGWMIGGGCIVSCWALMTACAAAGHSLPAMLFATGVGIAERRQFRPNLRLFSGVTAGFAVLYGVAALF